MSVSAIFGTKIAVVPNSASGIGGGAAKVAAPRRNGLVIECSSRPQKKATAHHRKTRPRKTQPWDVNRRPTVYPPLPTLPPDWTLVTPSDNAEGGVSPSPETLASE
ncbi:hypothetical protein L1049_026915 [Liquidambar formosana]|uniref:50S ribosomal protein 6, chloroplastic n=1 Tax=Liquidambar formosana TaxID=63359 RepID=A0AAP0NGD3_LIQFO